MFTVLYEKFREWLVAAQEPVFIERIVVEGGDGVRESPEDQKWGVRGVNVLTNDGCYCELVHSGGCQKQVYCGEHVERECDPDGVETLAAATKRSPLVGTAVWTNGGCGFETKEAASHRFCTELGVMAYAHICEKRALLGVLFHFTLEMCRLYPESMAHMGHLLQLDPRGTYSATEMAALRRSATYLQMIIECVNANRVPGDTSRTMELSESRYKSAVLKEKIVAQAVACNLLCSIDNEICKVAAGVEDVEKAIHHVCTSMDGLNTTIGMHQEKRTRFREPR